MDHNELAELKAELRRMQSRVEELESAAPEPVVNRRHLLRGLGAAAVGAAAGGLAFAHPAAATCVRVRASHVSRGFFNLGKPSDVAVTLPERFL